MPLALAGKPLRLLSVGWTGVGQERHWMALMGHFPQRRIGAPSCCPTKIRAATRVPEGPPGHGGQATTLLPITAASWWPLHLRWAVPEERPSVSVAWLALGNLNRRGPASLRPPRAFSALQRVFSSPPAWDLQQNLSRELAMFADGPRAFQGAKIPAVKTSRGLGWVGKGETQGRKRHSTSEMSRASLSARFCPGCISAPQVPRCHPARGTPPI